MKRFACLLLCAPISIFAEGGLPNQPYLYVEGRAQIQKSVDTVTLRFEIVSRAANQTKANEQTHAEAAKVFELLKNKGVADDDIIAEEFRTGAEFEDSQSFPRGRGKLVGYFASRPFEIRVRDVSRFPKLVEELLAIDGVEFSGIEGALSDEKEIGNQLWDKAVADARESAAKTAKAMGMKVDSVFAISPVSFPDIQSKIFSSAGAERVIVTGSNVPTLEETGLPKFRLAPITLTESVHVIYLISPVK